MAGEEQPREATTGDHDTDTGATVEEEEEEKGARPPCPPPQPEQLTSGALLGTGGEPGPFPPVPGWGGSRPLDQDTP